MKDDAQGEFECLVFGRKCVWLKVQPRTIWNTVNLNIVHSIIPACFAGMKMEQAGVNGSLNKSMPVRKAINPEVDLFQAYLTGARQPSARIYRPHPGLARRIPVDSSSRDHPVRRRSKGQMAT